MAAYARVAQRARGLDLSLSVKAPPLRFDPVSLRELAQIARQSGLSLMFDAHGPQDADDTLAAVERLLPDFPDTGMVLPARWQRSLADAARLHDSSAPVRVVRGEWPDPAGDTVDPDAAYLALVTALAGRAAPVAIATHRPALADRALTLLREAGTPCSLVQLRGCRAAAAVRWHGGRGCRCAFTCPLVRAGSPMRWTGRWRGPICWPGCGATGPAAPIPENTRFTKHVAAHLQHAYMELASLHRYTCQGRRRNVCGGDKHLYYFLEYPWRTSPY
ncbi:hypothetical protein ACFSUK_11085 [Sphingobium scionense]